MAKYYRVCTGFVGYHDDKIYSISIMTTAGDLIRLLEYEKDSKLPYQHRNFYEMYEDVLSVMRSNGFQPNYYFNFGARFYNIVWYDIEKPTSHSKHGLPVK